MEGQADGETFGRYRLLEVLRWGGIGQVYRAHDTMMNREVAIKVIPAELAAEPSYQERFRSEASIAAQLNDPNIIPVYEAGEIDGRLYLVTPVVDGIDLQSMLHRDGPMSPTLAVRIVEQAAAGLEVAHMSGLVHSDVRSSNILVVGGEFVYLVDFGVAAQAALWSEADAASWPYLAPERFGSSPALSTATALGDVYGLACVLYECLTGKPAFEGESVEQFVAAHQEGARPKPSDVDSAIPVEFDEVIARGLAKNPDDRYQTARELAFAARDALAPVANVSALTAQETEFGRYRLFELLGQGGMGSVYRAHDTTLGRDVAVKVLQQGLAAEEGYQERFRREAYAAGRLASPNIIPIYEAGEVDGRLYLVMPIIDGVDVHTLLAQGGPMAPERAVRVVEQVAAALDSAHKSGLVHRDVKPSNLLTVGEDFVYLIDFGLVHEASGARLTQTNVAPGTPAYMAPERFTSGTPADARADVYSLAAVLYECLTAQLPFGGGSVEALVVAHLQLEPPKPSRFDSSIPGRFDDVIARGMAKDPGDRYQSAGDLAAAARAALTDVADVSDVADVVVDAAPRTPATEPSDPTQYAAPPVGATPTEHAVSRSPRNRALTIAGRVAVVLVVVGAIVATGAYFAFKSHVVSQNSPPAQIVLPFTGLDGPQGVAVDAKGNVYIADTNHNRVLELAAGSTEPSVLAFGDLDRPAGVAVDNQGTVVVSEPANNRVLELPAGSTSPAMLPFTDLAEPMGVAVYTRGTDRVVYVADSGHNRVLALTVQSATQAELPFSGLDRPSAVAVDSVGGLFVIDRENERVLKLPATATVATVLPYAAGRPDFVAVDTNDEILVTDSRDNRVVKLAKASNTSIPLSFNGLKNPQGIAVDKAGNVYVADGGNNRVLKLPPS